MNEHDEANLAKQIDRMRGKMIGLERLLVATIMAASDEQRRDIIIEFRKHVSMGMFAIGGTPPETATAFATFADSVIAQISQETPS